MQQLFVRFIAARGVAVAVAAAAAFRVRCCQSDGQQHLRVNWKSSHPTLYLYDSILMLSPLTASLSDARPSRGGGVAAQNHSSAASVDWHGFELACRMKLRPVPSLVITSPVLALCAGRLMPARHVHIAFLKLKPLFQNVTSRLR